MNSDKAREWLQTVGVGLFIPAAVAWLAYSSATREVNAKMIEVAAQVLTGPVNDSMRPVRQWASKMLQHYSPVPFTDTAAATLARYPLVLGPLPGLTPIPLTEGPTQLFISPKSVTLRQSDWQDFVAIALTAAGDTDTAGCRPCQTNEHRLQVTDPVLALCRSPLGVAQHGRRLPRLPLLADRRRS